MDRIGSGPPESAADAVLAKCPDFQIPVPLFDGILNPFFQNAGGNPVPVNFSGYGNGRFVVHNFSLLPQTTY